MYSLGDVSDLKLFVSECTFDYFASVVELHCFVSVLNSNELSCF